MTQFCCCCCCNHRIFVEESAQITFDSKKEQFLVCHLDTEQETDFDLEQCVIDSYNSEEKGTITYNDTD